MPVMNEDIVMTMCSCRDCLWNGWCNITKEKAGDDLQFYGNDVQW